MLGDFLIIYPLKLLQDSKEGFYFSIYFFKAVGIKQFHEL